MKRTDLTIVAGVGLLALVAAFWFVILAPKRTEASDLQGQVTELEASVTANEQLAAAAGAAEQGYGENYHRLVVLGKAVPEDSDTPSLLVQLQRRADRADVSFDAIVLAEGSGAAAAASQVATPPPLTSPGSASGSTATPAASGSTGSSEAPAGSATAATPQAGTAASTAPGESGTAPATAPAATPVAATEATAATLPIGATVGPAGLPVMPYDLSFTGGFFEVADFLDGLDDMVHVSDTDLGVKGRLLTIDGFSLTPIGDATEVGKGAASDPGLSVSLAATTYLTPAEQGLVAGATSGAPAATTPATPTPASSTTTPVPAP